LLAKLGAVPHRNGRRGTRFEVPIQIVRSAALMLLILAMVLDVGLVLGLLPTIGFLGLWLLPDCSGFGLGDTLIRKWFSRRAENCQMEKFQM